MRQFNLNQYELKSGKDEWVVSNIGGTHLRYAGGKYITHSCAHSDQLAYVDWTVLFDRFGPFRCWMLTTSTLPKHDQTV